MTMTFRDNFYFKFFVVFFVGSLIFHNAALFPSNSMLKGSVAVSIFLPRFPVSNSVAGYVP